MERPDNFRLKYDHPLAQGLEFAALGNQPKTTLAKDSSIYNGYYTLSNMQPAVDWKWSTYLNRWCLNFNAGTNEYVSCSYLSAEACKHGTLTFWMYTPAYIVQCFVGSASLQTDQNGVGVGHNVNNYYFEVANATASAWTTIGRAVALNYWNFVSLSWSSNEAPSYFLVDKNEVVKGSYGSAVEPTSIAPLTMGKAPQGEAYQATSTIADVMLYNRRLSISELYLLGNYSNTMLSGMLLPPKRKYYVSGYSLPSIVKRHTKLGRLVLTGRF